MSNKLICPTGRVVVSIDMESKNSVTFENGQKIRLERDYNNLNKRYTMPVNAIVVASDYIPIGSEILVHHNSCHDVNRIFNYKPLGGENIASDIKYFSLPDTDVYMYRESKEHEWKPTKGFETALRIFKPYNGVIAGIEPTLVKNKLFITSGKLKNKAVSTLKSCDYEIIYMGDNGKDERFIRLRHFDTEQEQEREEIIAIDHSLTKKIFNGEYLVGLSFSDCKSLIELV